MINSFEKDLPVHHGYKPENNLPINQAAEYEPSEDLNNEEFVNANEKKFIPLEEFADPDSDFTEKQDEQAEEMEEADSSALESVRQDIKDYDYKCYGNTEGKMESFHVDHDNKEVAAIYNESERREGEAEPILAEEAHLEEEFADKNIEADAKMSIDAKRDRNDRRAYRQDAENLKTMSDSKLQRANRSLIRKFLDSFSRN